MMKVSRCFLFVLLPALSACGILGGGAATLSEKCYTDPQPKPSAQLALGGLQAGAETGAETRYVPGRLLVSYRGAADLHSTKQSSTEQSSTEQSSTEQSSTEQSSTEQSSTEQSSTEQSSTEQQGDKARLAVQKLEVTARKVRQSYDLRSLGTLGAPTATELVRTPPGRDVQKLAAELRRDPRVAYAEPDYYLYPLGLPSSLPAVSAVAAGLPNDPLVPEQWHLTKFGLPEAWRLETGKSSVVLAVLDSGVDLNHEDLVGRALPGCDVYNEDNDPNPGVSSRISGSQQHGTHVAGIGLASGNNGIGVAGVAYTGVKLLPVKVFDDNGGDPKSTSVSVVVKAIRWAAGLSVEGMNRNPNKANIINLSLGVEGQIDSLNQAVQDARNVGVLVVAASGNSYSANAIYTPANAPGALAVGSVDENHERSDYSAYSTSGRTVDLMAPGGAGQSYCGGILSTLSPSYAGAPESNYGCEEGTSMAAPFVAGVAALIWSQNPRLNADEVEAKLLASAEYTSAMNPAEYGAGVVCADRALGAATLCGN